MLSAYFSTLTENTLIFSFQSSLEKIEIMCTISINFKSCDKFMKILKFRSTTTYLSFVYFSSSTNSLVVYLGKEYFDFLVSTNNYIRFNKFTEISKCILYFSKLTASDRKKFAR